MSERSRGGELSADLCGIGSVWEEYALERKLGRRGEGGERHEQRRKKGVGSCLQAARLERSTARVRSRVSPVEVGDSASNSSRAISYARAAPSTCPRFNSSPARAFNAPELSSCGGS